MLASLGGYIAERVRDVQDVRDRLVSALTGRPAPGVPERSEPYVLVAHDLAPADTATLDPSLVLALVTQEGGPTSHTAILARSLGIPAVVAAKGATALPDGTLVLVDGALGRVRPNPRTRRPRRSGASRPQPYVQRPRRDKGWARRGVARQHRRRQGRGRRRRGQRGGRRPVPH